jgi:hypothetical protein
MVLDTLSSTPAPVVRFPVGLVGAVIATLAMDQMMARLPEGMTPPKVAAGVLTKSHPDEAPERLAATAHYLAGAGTGLLFVWLSLAVEYVVGDASVVTVLGTTALLFVLMVGFFVVVPLPRAPGLNDARRRRTGIDWAISAAAYLLVLVPVVTAGRVALA